MDLKAAAAPTAGRVRRRPSGRALGILWLVVVAVLTLPLAGHPMIAGGEYQYQAALTVALRDHLQWGSQVIWTYGPLGYMNVPAYMDFGTWLPAFFANMAAHALFFGVLALFLTRVEAKPAQWFAIGVIILIFFERYLGFEVERFPVLDHKAALIAVMLLFLANETQAPRLAAAFAAAAGLAVGFLLLSKATYIVFAAGLIAAYALISLVRRKPASIAALVGGVAVGFFSLWLAAGQSIGGVPGYFRSATELAAGYSAAMSWFSETWTASPELQQGIAVAMLAALVLGLIFALWRRDRALITLQLLALPLLVVTYRSSFIRFDEPHALTFWSLIAVVQGLVHVLLASRSQGARSAVSSALAGGTIVVGMVLVLGLGPALGLAPEFVHQITFKDNLASYPHALELIAQPGSRAKEEAQVQDALRNANPLPPDVVALLREGSVDVVPLDVQLPFAYGFQWSPQPVIQSYGVLHANLDEQDAQHLLGPNAPRFVVFSVASIDGRYPLFDEPTTYRVLLERYLVRFSLPDMLIFERRNDSVQMQQIAVGSVTGRLGEWIGVPDAGGRSLFGRVQVRMSPIGLAMNLLDRPPELHIRFRFVDQQVSPWFRFIAAVAPDGLLLTTYAPDTASLTDFLAGHGDRPIDAFQITADAPQQAYEQDIGVSYFSDLSG